MIVSSFCQHEESIDYPEGSRFVRVTGRDLDYVQRLKFDMAAGKAVTIESATAG